MFAVSTKREEDTKTVWILYLSCDHFTTRAGPWSEPARESIRWLASPALPWLCLRCVTSLPNPLPCEAPSLHKRGVCLASRTLVCFTWDWICSINTLHPQRSKRQRASCTVYVDCAVVLCHLCWTFTAPCGTAVDPVPLLALCWGDHRLENHTFQPRVEWCACVTGGCYCYCVDEWFLLMTSSSHNHGLFRGWPFWELFLSVTNCWRFIHL